MSEFAPFTWQWEMLTHAKNNGWPGDLPSVLGNNYANNVVSAAVRFLDEHGLISLDNCGTGLGHKIDPKKLED